MQKSRRLKAYNLGKRDEPDMNTNTTVEAHGAGRPSTHTQLRTTGIFQLSWERTRLKCFNKMETVRKIFMSGISQQCCLTRSPCGMMKEPSQADPPHSLACPDWAPARLPWAMDCQEKHLSQELWTSPRGCWSSWVRQRDGPGACREQAADRNPWKILLEMTGRHLQLRGRWEEEGKSLQRNGSFYRHGDQLQRRIFFSAYLFTIVSPG